MLYAQSDLKKSGATFSEYKLVGVMLSICEIFVQYCLYKLYGTKMRNRHAKS